MKREGEKIHKAEDNIRIKETRGREHEDSPFFFVCLFVCLFDDVIARKSTTDLQM